MVGRFLLGILVLLGVAACSDAALAQLSPDEKQVRALAQIIFEVQEANALLPAETYRLKIEVTSGVTAPDCPGATGAAIDLRVARSKRETTESLELLSAARLTLSTARLAKSNNDAGADAAMNRAIEQLVTSSIQAQILRNRNSGPEYSKALADVEIAQTICMTPEQYRAKAGLETIQNREMVQILNTSLLKSVRSRASIQQLLDSAAPVEARTLDARKNHPQVLQADGKLKELGGGDAPEVVASRKALDEAIKKAARSK